MWYAWRIACLRPRLRLWRTRGNVEMPYVATDPRPAEPRSRWGFGALARFSVLALGACGSESTPPALDPEFEIICPTGCRAVIPPGGVDSIRIEITRRGGPGPIAFGVDDLPPKVTATFAPPVADETISTVWIRLSVGPDVLPGDYAPTIRARATNLADRVATLGLSIPSPPRLRLTLLSDPPRPPQRGIARVRLRVATAGLSQVFLAIDSLPSGVAAIISPNPTDSTSVVTVSASDAASPQLTSFLIRATHPNALPDTLRVPLEIRPAPTGDFSLKFTPPSAAQGRVTVGQITVVPSADYNGGRIALRVEGLSDLLRAILAPDTIVAAGDLKFPVCALDTDRPVFIHDRWVRQRFARTIRRRVPRRDRRTHDRLVSLASLPDRASPGLVRLP